MTNYYEEEYDKLMREISKKLGVDVPDDFEIDNPFKNEIKSIDNQIDEALGNGDFDTLDDLISDDSFVDDDFDPDESFDESEDYVEN